MRFKLIRNGDPNLGESTVVVSFNDTDQEAVKENVENFLKCCGYGYLLTNAKNSDTVQEQVPN